MYIISQILTLPLNVNVVYYRIILLFSFRQFGLSLADSFLTAFFSFSLEAGFSASNNSALTTPFSSFTAFTLMWCGGFDAVLPHEFVQFAQFDFF